MAIFGELAIFSEQSSFTLARESIQAALNSKSIQLLGPQTVALAEEHAKADARYLAALIKELVTELGK